METSAMKHRGDDLGNAFHFREIYFRVFNFTRRRQLRVNRFDALCEEVLRLTDCLSWQFWERSHAVKPFITIFIMKTIEDFAKLTIIWWRRLDRKKLAGTTLAKDHTLLTCDSMQNFKLYSFVTVVNIHFMTEQSPCFFNISQLFLKSWKSNERSLMM